MNDVQKAKAMEEEMLSDLLWLSPYGALVLAAIGAVVLALALPRTVEEDSSAPTSPARTSRRRRWPQASGSTAASARRCPGPSSSTLALAIVGILASQVP